MIRVRTLGVRIAALAALAAPAACGFQGKEVVGQDDAAVDAAPDAPSPPPVLAPELKDFGQYDPAGAALTEVFTIQTVDPVPVITTSIGGTNAADFTISNDTCNNFTLHFNGSCTLTVTFAAKAQTGARTATLRATAGGGVDLHSDLRGRWDVPAALVASSNLLAFGTVHVGVPSMTKTFMLTNPGTVPTTIISTVKAGTDAGEFAITGDTCTNSTLAPMAACSMTVQYLPNSVGDKSAMITATATTGGTQIIALSGTGEALTFTPSPVDFMTVPLTTTATPIPVTVTNVAANAVGPIVTALAGNNPGDFVLSADTCNTTTLATQTTCTLSVAFAPTALGPRNALIRITVAGVIIADDVVQGVGVDLERLTITPTPFAFPDTVIATTSTAQQFTVTNTGTATTAALAVALGGTDPTQFAIVMGADTCTGTLLAVNATCTVDVVFKPTAVTAGAKSATLTVSATPGGSATAMLSGTELAVPPPPPPPPPPM